MYGNAHDANEVRRADHMEVERMLQDQAFRQQPGGTASSTEVEPPDTPAADMDVAHRYVCEHLWSKPLWTLEEMAFAYFAGTDKLGEVRTDNWDRRFGLWLSSLRKHSLVPTAVREFRREIALGTLRAKESLGEAYVTREDGYRRIFGRPAPWEIAEGVVEHERRDLPSVRVLQEDDPILQAAFGKEAAIPHVREAGLAFKGNHVVFSVRLADGRVMQRAFPASKDGTQTNFQKMLHLLAYFHDGDNVETYGRAERGADSDPRKGITVERLIPEFVTKLPATTEECQAALKKVADILTNIDTRLQKVGMPSGLMPKLDRKAIRTDPGKALKFRLRLNVPMLHRSGCATLVSNQGSIRNSPFASYDDNCLSAHQIREAVTSTPDARP